MRSFENWISWILAIEFCIMNESLRIGMVCYPSYGGSGVVATELGRSLAKRGHLLHFISYETPFRLLGFEERIHYHEVDLEPYPLFKYPLYSIALTSKIIEVCESEKLDLLHVHYAIPHSISAYLSQQILEKKVRVLCTLHGTDITLVGLQKSYYSLVRFGILQSDALSSVSEYLKAKTLKEFHIDREITVIPNFVDTQRFSPENSRLDCKPRSIFVQEEQEKIVMHISNFRPIKNLPTVLRVFHSIQKKIPSKLVLVGDGPEMATVRSLAKELGILSRIRFLGRVDQVESILPCADIFLMPSYLESFGLALLEAMSCGVPTISSNTGGITELVEHGKTGFVFDPEDVSAMAEKSIEILENHSLYKELSRNGREWAHRFFHQENIVDRYEELYRKIL